MKKLPSLTKKQRKQIYLDLLEKYASSECDDGLCILLGNLLPDGFVFTPDREIYASFPEVFMFAKRRGNYIPNNWWGDDPNSWMYNYPDLTIREYRMTILCFALAVLEDKE